MQLESPKRKWQKQKDYQRKRIIRKIQRRNKSKLQQYSKIAEKELKRQLRSKKFAEGKDDGKTIYTNFTWDYPIEYNGNSYPTTEGTINGIPHRLFSDGNNIFYIGEDGKAVQTSPVQKLPEQIVTPISKGYESSFNSYDTPALLNAMTLGVLNRISPTQNIRLIKDVFNKNYTLDDIMQSAIIGNNGVASNKFTQAHPYQSIMYNALLDGIVGGGGSILKSIDSGTLNNAKLLSPKNNTMMRLIGMGDSGYKDLLSSGIVRANPHPTSFGLNTEQLHKIQRTISSDLSEDDVRAFASQNIKSQQQLDRLNNAINKYRSSNKNSLLPERFEQLQDIKNKDNNLIFLSQFGKDPKNIVSKNWINYSQQHAPNAKLVNDVEYHNLPTFVVDPIEQNDLLKQDISKGGYVGDYAVRINNANKYSANATSYGHFKEHPTTIFPVEINNPDLDVYVRKDGLLSGKKYMKKLDKSVVLNDAELLRKTGSVKNRVRKNTNSIVLPVDKIQNIPVLPSINQILYNKETTK